MKRYALIDHTGNVVNVTVWDGVTPWQPEAGLVVVEDVDGRAAAGGRYESGSFLPPPQPPIPPAPTPSLSPRQIRLALLSAGITESMVDTALVGNEAGMIEWKFATMYKRDHPLIDALAGSFSLTAEQVGMLWGEAAQL